MKNIDETNLSLFHQTFWPDKCGLCEGYGPIFPSFHKTIWPYKWGLRESYDETNRNEKGFQLFLLFIDR